MAFNRYTQQSVYSQYNPLSLQELSMVPLAKQQKHDAQLSMALQQKAAAQALLKDQAEADRLIGEVDQRINNYTQELMTTGVSNNSLKNLLDLKNYRDNLMSSKGDLGKINANFAAYQSYKTNLDEMLKANKITKTTYDQALASSMQQYQGYQKGSFNGYVPSEYANNQQILADFEKEIKQSKNSIGGWTFTPNYMNTGKDVWVKGTQTTTTTPPGVREAMMARLMSDPRVQANLRDEMYFMETLGLYQPDENGNYTINQNSYTPEEFAQNPELRRQYAQEVLQNKLTSQVIPFDFLAHTGQGKEIDYDIKLPKGDGDGNGYTPPGGDVISDPFTPTHFGGSAKGIEGIQDEIAALRTNADNYSQQKANRLEQHLENIEYRFQQTAQGQELKDERDSWINQTTFELGINKEQAAMMAKSDVLTSLTDIFGKKQTVYVDSEGNKYNTRQEFIDKVGKNPTVNETRYTRSGLSKLYTGKEFLKFESKAGYLKGNRPDYQDKFNDYVSSGQLLEGRLYSVGGNKLKDLNENKEVLKNVISPSLYQVQGQEASESSTTINKILGSDIISMGYVSYGDYDTPYLRILYKPQGSGPDHVGEEVMLRPKELSNAQLQTSYEQGLSNLFSDRPEIIRKFKDELQYFGVDDFTNMLPNLANEYESIKIGSEPYQGTNRYFLEIDNKPVSLRKYLTEFDDNAEEKIAKLKKQNVNVDEVKYYTDRSQLINVLKYIDYYGGQQN